MTEAISNWWSDIFTDVPGVSTKFVAIDNAASPNISGEYVGFRGQTKTYMSVQASLTQPAAEGAADLQTLTNIALGWSVQADKPEEGQTTAWNQSTMVVVPGPAAAGGAVSAGITKFRWWAEKSVASGDFWNADTALVINKVQSAQSTVLGWDLKEDQLKWGAYSTENKNQVLTAVWTRDYDGLISGTEKFALKVGTEYPMAWMSAVFANLETQTVE